MAKYCSQTHRNRAYQSRRAGLRREDLNEVSDQVAALAAVVDVAAVLVPLNRLRAAAGLHAMGTSREVGSTPETPVVPVRRSTGHKTTKHGWAVWRELSADRSVRFKYSTHTTEGGAGSACRRLQRVWVDHQRRNEVSRWQWRPAENNGERGFDRADADLFARMMIPIDMNVLSNDLREQVVVRRATSRRTHWDIGTAMKSGADRLQGLESAGPTVWEIDTTRTRDWSTRHPYVDDLLHALYGPQLRIDRPSRSTTRRPIAQQRGNAIGQVVLSRWRDCYGYVAMRSE